MQQFSKAIFEALPVERRQQLCGELRTLMVIRLQQCPDFSGTVWELVDRLRAFDHDLLVWDEDVDKATFGPDYEHPPMTGLLLEFWAPDGVDVAWLQDRGSGEVQRALGLRA